MRLLDIVAVAVRLLVLIMFYQILGGLPWLASQIGAWQQEIETVHRGMSPWYSALGLFWQVVILLIIFRFPLTMARILVPPSARDVTIEGGNAESLQLAGFVLVGIYMVAWGVVDIFSNGTILLTLSTRGLGDSDFFVRAQGYLVATVVQIVVGLFVMLGSGGVLRFVRRMCG